MKRAKLKSLIQKNKDDLFDMQYSILTNEYCWWMRTYLGYDEDTGGKATLAQEDVRFSRTIQRIQKTVIAELNKLAMIHLYSHGFQVYLITLILFLRYI